MSPKRNRVLVSNLQCQNGYTSSLYLDAVDHSASCAVILRGCGRSWQLSDCQRQTLRQASALFISHPELPLTSYLAHLVRCESLPLKMKVVGTYFELVQGNNFQCRTGPCSEFRARFRRLRPFSAQHSPGTERDINSTEYYGTFK